MVKNTNYDKPYFYHKNLLELLINCIVNEENKQYSDIFGNGVISLNYALDFIKRDDVFCMSNPIFEEEKAPLVSVLKTSVLKYFNLVWLKTNSKISAIANNKKISKFIQLEIDKLHNIDED